MLASVGVNGSVSSISWCAAFVSFCIKQAFPTFKGSSNSQYPATKEGETEYTKLDQPIRGAIIVWSRGGGHGHTAFYLGEAEGGRIETIGGNQTVKGTDENSKGQGVSSGPTSKDGNGRSFVGYYWPKVAGSGSTTNAISNTATNAANTVGNAVMNAADAVKPAASGGTNTKPTVMDIIKPGKEQVRTQRELPLGITERLARATGATSKVTLPSVGDHTVPGSGTAMKKAKNDMLWGAAAKIGNAVLQNTAMKDSVLGKGVTDLLDRLIKVTEDNKKVQEKLLDVNKQQEGHLKETAKNTKAPPVNTTTVVNKEPEDLYSYASGIFKEFIKN
jgi:uncharacterized protein (TIGR02594 family)